MVKKSTAQEFIDKLDSRMSCNVDIIDENGIIIASRDQASIGIFHEQSYRLIREHEEVEHADTDPALPKDHGAGIYLPLMYDGRTIGALGVTGTPDETPDLGYVLKSSFEMLVETEHFKERLFRRRSRKNQFMSFLLIEEPYNQPLVEGMSQTLGYDLFLTRVPVLMRMNQDTDFFDLIPALKENGTADTQDMNFVTPEGSLLVFKHLKLESGSILDEYRSGMGQFVSHLHAACRNFGSEPGPVFIGPPQNQLEYYRTGYRQLQWLEGYIPAGESGGIFFLDYMKEYFFSLIPKEEFMSSFRVFYSCLSPLQRKILFHTVRTLNETNLNIKEAASRLGIHRNTVTARLDKIRDIFGVDVINDPRGKDFMFLMMIYDYLLGNGKTVHD